MDGRSLQWPRRCDRDGHRLDARGVLTATGTTDRRIEPEPWLEEAQDEARERREAAEELGARGRFPEQVDIREPAGDDEQVARGRRALRSGEADAAREALEIETSAADTPAAWEAVAVPGVNPGDCVAFVGAGDIDRMAREWLKAVASEQWNAHAEALRAVTRPASS